MFSYLLDQLHNLQESSVPGHRVVQPKLIVNLPAHQGAGTGFALMTEALKAVDLDGLIAHLESSNPGNISLSQRQGFEVIGEIQSGNSPVLRPLLRRAR